MKIISSQGNNTLIKFESVEELCSYIESERKNILFLDNKYYNVDGADVAIYDEQQKIMYINPTIYYSKQLLRSLNIYSDKIRKIIIDEVKQEAKNEISITPFCYNKEFMKKLLELDLNSLVRVFFYECDLTDEERQGLLAKKVEVIEIKNNVIVNHSFPQGELTKIEAIAARKGGVAVLTTDRYQRMTEEEHNILTQASLISIKNVEINPIERGTPSGPKIKPNELFLNEAYKIYEELRELGCQKHIDIDCSSIVDISNSSFMARGNDNLSFNNSFYQDKIKEIKEKLDFYKTFTDLIEEHETLLLSLLSIATLEALKSNCRKSYNYSSDKYEVNLPQYEYMYFIKAFLGDYCKNNNIPAFKVSESSPYIYIYDKDRNEFIKYNAEGIITYSINYIMQNNINKIIIDLLNSSDEEERDLHGQLLKMVLEVIKILMYDNADDYDEITELLNCSSEEELIEIVQQRIKFEARPTKIDILKDVYNELKYVIAQMDIIAYKQLDEIVISQDEINQIASINDKIDFYLEEIKELGSIFLKVKESYKQKQKNKR